MRDRLLLRHFLWRFLENDLVSPGADRRVVLSAVGGALGALSLFTAILVATPYQFFNAMPPGLTAVRSLDDRFLFVSSSMLVMALAAVAQWDALALDARDTAVLGALPIPRGTIVRTKFLATALFALAVLAAWNLFPTLLRAVALPIGLHIGLIAAVRLTLAHALVTSAAGIFGFLAVLGLRETLFAVLGARPFRRVSAAVQAALIVLLMTALLLLPGVDSVARRWRSQAIAAKALPPSWFVGLHETLAGSVIDGVPHTRPGRFLIRPERDATDLYRALWPLFYELAVIAAVASCVVAIATIAACVWNSRRLPIETSGAVASHGRVRLAWHWIVVHVVATTPLCQAGFFFTVHTLSRRVSHRVAMASAWALGLALIVVAAGGGRMATAGARGPIPLAILAAQPLLLGSVLNGFRRATRMPSELRANSTFSLAWSGTAAPFLSGVKRAGWMAVVIPALLGLAIWHAAILGPRLAALHLGVGVAVAALFMEIMFFRYRCVPFVAGYGTTVDVKLRVTGFLVALVAVSFALAWIERSSFSAVSGYMTLIAILAGASLGLAVLDRVSSSPLTLDLDEEFLPTQRLNLAR